VGFRSNKNRANHLFIPAFLLFAVPNSRGVVIRIPISILTFDNVALLALLHAYTFLHQQVHIAANFRFILRCIFVSSRRLRVVLLLEETRVLSQSIPPLLNYLNIHLDPIHENPLHSVNDR
jgi:hypothetical protein